MARWNNKCPIIIVPTKYYKTPTEKFKELGISLVIWANHNMRAAIKIMEETSKIIFEEQSLINIEKKITTVNEIFNYTKEDELKVDESLYTK
jgi:phosphoenolpyruvate phosphomutase